MPSDFFTLYQEHQAFVRALIYRLCGQSELDDLTQECFIRIWKNRQKFRGNSSPKTWIYRIVTNLCVDHLRRSSSSPVWVEEAKETSGTKSDVLLSLSLRETLAKMDPESRASIILFFVEGYTQREIAEIMSIPEGTVKSRIHFARKTFKNLLKEGKR